MSELRVVLGVVVATVLAVGAGLAIAAAQPEPTTEPGPGFGAVRLPPGEPRTEAWAEAGVDLAPGLDPTAAGSCRRGDPECLDAVIVEMEARLEALGCEHTAPFAFTYLEMTRGVQQRVRDPDFFVEPAALAHLDGIFARQYFDAFDNWYDGRSDEVPPAWQMAFAAADRQTNSAAADLLLGMNAHITRDLAFAVAVLADVPGLSEDAVDFDQVNAIIDEVRGPMLEASASRFDPELAELELELEPGVAVDAVDLIARWRQQAFDQGVRLAAADSDDRRREVAAEIERTAVAAAAVILNADAALESGSSTAERLAWCERTR
jgi:hypothetical protein